MGQPDIACATTRIRLEQPSREPNHWLRRSREPKRRHSREPNPLHSREPDQLHSQEPQANSNIKTLGIFDGQIRVFNCDPTGNLEQWLRENQNCILTEVDLVNSKYLSNETDILTALIHKMPYPVSVCC